MRWCERQQVQGTLVRRRERTQAQETPVTYLLRNYNLVLSSRPGITKGKGFGFESKGRPIPGGGRGAHEIPAPSHRDQLRPTRTALRHAEYSFKTLAGQFPHVQTGANVPIFVRLVATLYLKATDANRSTNLEVLMEAKPNYFSVFCLIFGSSDSPTSRCHRDHGVAGVELLDGRTGASDHKVWHGARSRASG